MCWMVCLLSLPSCLVGTFLVPSWREGTAQPNLELARMLIAVIVAKMTSGNSITALVIVAIVVLVIVVIVETPA